MGLMLNRLTAGLALLMLAGLGQARDIYVSPSGNNGSPGTLDQPYRTPAHAATLVNPGDTVWLMNGEYEPFTLTRSGTSNTQRITWKAYPGHKPHILYKAGRWSAISVKAEYQTLDGLILTGNNGNVTRQQAEADLLKSIPTFFARNPVTGTADINPATGQPITVDTPNPSYVAGYVGDAAFNNSGISLDNRTLPTTVHHLTVKNSIIRNFGCGGVVVLQADYTVLENNKIYNNAWYSRYGCSGATVFTKNKLASDTFTGHRNKVVNNVFWNNRGLVRWLGRPGGPGLSDGNGYIQDISAPDYAGRTLISGNVSVNNGGSGIHAFEARRVDIVNNSAYMNGQVVGYADIYASYSTDVKLLNNIAYAKPGGTANNNKNNTNVVYNHNIYYNHATLAAGTKGPNDLEADPLFVSPSLTPCYESSDTLSLTCTANFQLQGNSPAIDSGTTVAGVTPTSDARGVTRPKGAGLDRGALEYDIVPRIVSSLTLSGTVGQPFSYAISAYNFPKSFAVTGLPPGSGLRVNTTTGVISGTPTAADRGTRTLVLKATNPVGTGSENAQLRIN